MTVVAPLASGPYTTYEWPVTQPTSAVHQCTSSSRMSHTHLCVAVMPVRYPPVVWMMPLGLPVDPEVYSRYSRSSESIGSAGQRASASLTKSSHQISRPLCIWIG